MSILKSNEQMTRDQTNRAARFRKSIAHYELQEKIDCALDLKRAWGQEKRDQLAAGASQKTIGQIDDILASILDDIRALNRQRKFA